MCAATYTFFDHTGDSGVDIEAPSVEDAVAASARAFLDLLTDDPETVGEVEAVPVAVDGVDPADLLVNLGNELLYLFEVDRFLCARFVPSAVTETRIEGTAHGERYDPKRHAIARPVKAVTHHGAMLERRGTSVQARLVYDL